jgi:spore coat protein A
MVSRIVLRFDLPGSVAAVSAARSGFPAGYVQHCHMLEHENNEMMRPWQVIR